MMGSPELPQDDQNDFNASAMSNVTVGAMDNGSDGSDESDIETMDNDYGGYQPLPGDDDNTVPMNEDDNEADEPQAPHVRQSPLPEIANRITELEESVWNAPRPETSTIELDSTRTAQILSAMSQISIPTEFTPSWAREISEEKWKEDLLQRIRSRQPNASNQPDE